MGYVTQSRHASVLDIPFCLPQSELRRGSSLLIGFVDLKEGQRLQFRQLAINVVKILTSGVAQDTINTEHGLATLGVYHSTMLCSPVIEVAGKNTGLTSLNPFISRDIVNPGRYSVVVYNNTGRTASTAVDLSVSVTGVAKLYIS